MIDKFISIGFSEKEARVYLYIVEYGTSASSEVARRLGYPKSTVNFLTESLWKKGFLKKIVRKNIHYYEADTDLLGSQITREIDKKNEFLLTSIPVLQEMTKNVVSKPKIIFLDGEDQCKQAYLEILSTKQIFFEFGAHADLVRAFGEAFMTDFIKTRKEKGIFCDSIGSEGPMEHDLQLRDQEELRSLKLYSSEYGSIRSSIAIYDDKVLILNLENTYSGVCIENRAFAESMRTIYMITKSGK